MRQKKLFFKYLQEHNGQIIVHNDEAMINILLEGKISPLPPKFGIFGFDSYKNSLNNYLYYFPKGESQYDLNEFLEAFTNPSIVHITYPKSWGIKNLKPHGNYFYKYLYKTDYYYEHLKKYLEEIK